MLRLAGGQVESLLDGLLPVEVRELPAELAVLDRLLADPRLLAPITQAWEQTARGHGRPTIPMASFVRLMVSSGAPAGVRDPGPGGVGLAAPAPVLPVAADGAGAGCVHGAQAGPPARTRHRQPAHPSGDRQGPPETRFAARAVRIDATVVEADIRYPTDGVLAWQGARALAREAASWPVGCWPDPAGGGSLPAARQDGAGDLTDVGSAHRSATR